MLNEQHASADESCMCHFSAVPGKEVGTTGVPTAEGFSVLTQPYVLMFSFNASEVTASGTHLKD